MNEKHSAEQPDALPGLRREMSAEAVSESIPLIEGFVEECMEEAGVPVGTIMRVNVAVDEIVSNIARYSGAANVTVCVEAEAGRVRVRFEDDGVPYDPSKQPEPDTTLSAEERSVGGLGIHLVRGMTDELIYAYKEGRNILTVEKRF